jgi:hypothetical protein
MSQAYEDRFPRLFLLVSLLPVPEGVQDNFAFENVVAETVLAPSNPPLAVARANSNKLLDLVLL